MLIALATLQEPTQCSVTTFLRLRPRAIEPRWFMAHMLIVAACEFRDPVLRLIKMEADDRLLHPDAPPNA